MKKQILFACALVQTWCLIAGTMQEAFLKGNAAYLSGDINEALNHYKSIEPKGPAVVYNMGNCYYRLNNYPEAIVQWRRAQKDASWQDFDKLEGYISQAYQVVGVDHETSIFTRIQTWVARCGSLCSLFILQILFLCCLFTLFVALPTLLKQARYYTMIILIVSTFCVIFIGVVTYRNQEYPYGIVTKNSISVYAGPGVDYARLTEAKMLDTVRVYQRRDGWLKVRVDQFGYGWIQETDLAVI